LHVLYSHYSGGLKSEEKWKKVIFDRYKSAKTPFIPAKNHFLHI
jgi:hypothetical protein